MPFKKGNNANPKGRPRTGQSLAEYIRKLAGQNGKTYADILHNIAVHSEDERMQVTALGILIERGYGKVPLMDADPTQGQPTRVIYEFPPQ